MLRRYTLINDSTLKQIKNDIKLSNIIVENAEVTTDIISKFKIPVDYHAFQLYKEKQYRSLYMDKYSNLNTETDFETIKETINLT